MDTYELFYRNIDGSLAGQILTFDRFEMTPVFNGVGSWSLLAPVDVLNQLVWRGGIVVKRNGNVFFSGPVTRLTRIKNNISTPMVNTLEAQGENDLGYLCDRLALPVPAGPPYTTAEYDVRSGPFESVAKAFVNFNAGPGAKPDRMVNGLSIQADGARGTVVTGQARFDLLIDLLESLATQSGGVGFDIVGMEFQVFETRDLRASIIFSEDLGSLSGYRYDISRSRANYVYLGGAGDGSARLILENLDPASVLEFGRIEQFLDRASLSDSTQMTAEIQEELVRRSKQFSLKLDIVDLPKMKPIDDYWLGDQVTAVIDGKVVQDVISSMQITITQNGIEIVPTIGINDYDGDEISALYAELRSISERIGSLERK